MSLASSHSELRARCRDLSQAVTELVTIVHEDRPTGSETALVDHVRDMVSELQAAAVGAIEELEQVTEPRDLPAHLGPVDRAVADCATTYWRELRAFRPTHELRRAAHGSSLEWRAWQRSVETSQLRCELPILEAADAIRSAWREVAELLGLYLPAPHPHAAPEPATTPVAGRTLRRSQ